MGFEEVNQKKKKFELEIIVGRIIVIISFILFIPMGMSSSGGAFIIMIPFLGGGILSIYGTSQIKKLSTKFKKQYVQSELEKVFPGSKFFSHYGFTESEVVHSNLLKNQDRYKSEDMIEGDFDGVKFRSSDVHQEDVRRSGKHTTVVTVFRGRFYEFDFNKVFKYNLLLLQKGQFRPFEGFNKVNMESIAFNSELKVYAKDDHEAFYILTPQFMEKLLLLDRKYNDKITFSFLDNKLYIAVDNRVDNFDIKAFRQVNSAFINSYVEEFEDMKEFIAMLSLTSRMFKDV